MLADHPKHRVQSVDLLRGIVMVIMAIDHVRDFFHEQASIADPTDLSTTTPQLFFTRWITHFCAPVFVLLAGVAAYLSGTRKTGPALGKSLLIRGLWLILVELAVMSFLFTFNPFYRVLILQVIWAIGVSMVMLSLVVRLPFGLILGMGLSILLLHNLMDYREEALHGQMTWWWRILHERGTLKLSSRHIIFILYPILPWIGVMFCGYCLGALYVKGFPEQKRKKLLLLIGCSLIFLFILLRTVNFYGDPTPWHRQPSTLYSVLSFLNTNKYPPSLMYLCMTLGPAIVLLALIEHVQSGWSRFFIVFGRVPFFYYIVHFLYIHVLTVIVFFASGYTPKDIIPERTPFLFRPDYFGFSLPVVYLIWLTVVLSLYPLCRWYDRYKSTHDHWWLSYV